MFNLSELLTVEAAIALLTLASLEIVLGIDNIVFIAILSDKLPEEKRARTRNIGILMAMIMRLGLLFAIGWVVKLTNPIITIGESLAFSGKDLIMLIGGLFLVAKATVEIHHKIEASDHVEAVPDLEKARRKPKPAGVTVGSVLFQIILLDAVFSLDSVITAVGMVKQIEIMVVAVLMAVVVMLIFAGPISRFIIRHPTLKILALSFLILIGFTLMLEGFHIKVPKGYIYSAMGFSLGVELINLKIIQGMQAKRQAAN